MKKKALILFALVVLSFTAIAGCSSGSSREEKEYTEKIKSESLDAVGLPNISNYFEMSQLKNIYELRDNPDLICYWYTKNQMSGKWVYEGKCIGYGIPYGASITSPEKYTYEGGTLPLAEPNGLYLNGLSTSATWILSIDKKGNTKPTYVESEITVSQEKIDKSKCEEWSIPSDY